MFLTWWNTGDSQTLAFSADAVSFLQNQEQGPHLSICSTFFNQKKKSL